MTSNQQNEADALIDVRDAIRGRIREWEEQTEGAPTDEEMKLALQVLQGRCQDVNLSEQFRDSLERLTDAIATCRRSHTEEHQVVAQAELDEADQQACALLANHPKDKDYVAALTRYIDREKANGLTGFSLTLGEDAASSQEAAQVALAMLNYGGQMSDDTRNFIDRLKRGEHLKDFLPGIAGGEPSKEMQEAANAAAERLGKSLSRQA